MLSGYLLAEYCPDAHACDASTGQELGELGSCDGRSMWGIITALTLTSPLLILTLQVVVYLLHALHPHCCQVSAGMCAKTMRKGRAAVDQQLHAAKERELTFPAVSMRFVQHQQ